MPSAIPGTRLRNIGIMAHIDAGKTTCAERILFFTGRIRKMGEVHHGSAALDFDPLEQKKGITINAAATSVGWTPARGPFAGVAHRVQIVDTPGHIDFTIEVERSLRVLDGAVFVLDASQGVECQSETVFRQAERHGVPCIAFVNKVDKVGADLDMCLRDVRERLGVTPVAVHFPLGEGASVRAIVDVLAREIVRFDDDVARAEPIPAELAEAVEARRRAVVEACAEVDHAVLESFCEGRDVDAATLARALREGTRERKLMVVTCGSALKSVGIQTLLDAVVDYLPSPIDLPPVRGEHPETGAPLDRRASDEEPLAALAFKTVADRGVGFLSYVRVYSGVLEAGASVRVGSTGARERVGRVYLPHADQREEVASAGAGAIVAVTGLRDVRTGETLSSTSSPIVLERITAPEPVVEVAIEPRTADDRDGLGRALGRLLFEDPSLRAFFDAESGQTRLRGMGLLHLEVAVDKLARDHKVAVAMGKPEVAYRETVARPSTAAHRHVKQDGGAGQFACVTLAVSPAPRGSGVAFSDETVGGVVPKDFVSAVEKGVRAAAARGVFAGYPVVDVAVALRDGETHVKDSSAAAFEVAGSLAFQAACRDAGLVLLEPYCALEVTVPQEHGGDVIGDLGGRRGKVERVSPRGNALVLEARAPLGATFDYVAVLRGLTHGRGTAAIRPAAYEIAPPAVAARVAG
ncbi:MAG: elongation factor G [Myxococcales bacterium]|nr:elongation factor G [Myxococcales bacterium]